MITKYTKRNFEIFNRVVHLNEVIFVVKNRIFHAAVYIKDRHCLFTNMYVKGQAYSGCNLL